MWRQWWRASWTGRQFARWSGEFQRAAQESLLLRWAVGVHQEVAAHRRRWWSLAWGTCAITALAATFAHPDLRTPQEVAVRLALLLGLGIVMQRVIAR